MKIELEIVMDAKDESDAYKKTLESLRDILDDASVHDFEMEAMLFTDTCPINWDSRCLPYGRKDQKTIGDILNGL